MVVTWRSSLVTEDAGSQGLAGAAQDDARQNGKDLVTAKPSQHSYQVRPRHGEHLRRGPRRPGAEYDLQLSNFMRRRDHPRLFLPVADRGHQYRRLLSRSWATAAGDYQLFGKLMKMAREAGARFVVATGDMTDSGTQPEWNLWFQRRRRDFALSALDAAPRQPRDADQGRISSSSSCRMPTPRRRITISPMAWPNSACSTTATRSSSWTKTIPWLEARFAASPLPWKFIALHKPPYASVPYIIDSLKDGMSRSGRGERRRHGLQRPSPYL